MTQTSFEQQVLSKLAVIESDLTDVKKAIDGNGRPGISDRLTTLETLVKERTETNASRKEVLGVSAAGSGLLVLLLEFLKAKLGIQI